MAVGQSIAPTSDVVMRVPGAVSTDAGRRSIDPTDYMGQSFIYQKWLDEKKKEIEQKQQNQVDIVLARQENEAPALKLKEDELNKELETIRSDPQYKKMVEEDGKKRTEYIRAHPGGAGSYTALITGVEKYNEDVNSAEKDVIKAKSDIKSAKLPEEYEKAKERYNTAVSKMLDVVKSNPTTTEGQEKYKDELKQMWNKGITYATGWGAGGYSGSGAGSASIADRLLANVTGATVGAANPSVMQSPTQVMKDLGYTLKENPSTGQMSYFDASGKAFEGTIPGTQSSIYGGLAGGISKAVTGTNTADVLTNMLGRMGASGQRATDEQLAEAAKAVTQKTDVGLINQYANLVAQYQVNPTTENKIAAEAFSMDSGAMRANLYNRTLEGLKNISGTNRIEEFKLPSGSTRTGSIMGADIFTTKEGKSFLVKNGEAVMSPIPGAGLARLEDIADQRRLAGKTGEYNLYNYPGMGGSEVLESQSQQAKQYLVSMFGDQAGIKAEAPLPVVGTTMVEGRSLPIVQYGGRDFVKPGTGSLVPLSIVTELKNLSNKTGDFKNNDPLYNQEMDVIRSFKQYYTTKSPEDRAAFIQARQNISTNPDLTIERAAALNTILTTGSAQAGMKMGTNNILVPDSNVAKGILEFTSRNPVENVVTMGIITKEGADNPMVADTIMKMPKYGDLITGAQNLPKVDEFNKARGNAIFNIDTSNPGYGSLVENIAKGSASRMATEKDVTFNIPENMKIGYMSSPQGITLPSNVEVTQGANFDIFSGKPVTAKINTENLGKVAAKTDQPRKVANPTSVLIPASSFGRMNTTSPIGMANITSLQRKSKKSKPKMNVKLKSKPKKSKKKSDTTMESFERVTKNMAKFTISMPGMKKKKK